MAALTIIKEGFWKYPTEPNNPEPVSSNDKWFLDNKENIISALKKIQSLIKPFKTIGPNFCKMCNINHVSEEFTCTDPANARVIWKWPVALLHYIDKHNVCPSDAFLSTILKIEKESINEKEKIIELLKRLSPEERVNLLTDNFCMHCFDTVNPCYCTRDD